MNVLSVKVKKSFKVLIHSDCIISVMKKDNKVAFLEFSHKDVK